MKTIIVGGMEIKLTPERIRRTLDARAETQRLLDKELKYSEDLQHSEVIDLYRKHIAHLDEILA